MSSFWYTATTFSTTNCLKLAWYKLPLIECEQLNEALKRNETQSFFLCSMAGNDLKKVHFISDMNVPMAVNMNDGSPIIQHSESSYVIIDGIATLFGLQISTQPLSNSISTPEESTLLQMLFTKLCHMNQAHKKYKQIKERKRAEWYYLSSTNEGMQIWIPFKVLDAEILHEFFNERMVSSSSNTSNGEWVPNEQQLQLNQSSLTVRFVAFDLSKPYALACSAYSTEDVLIVYHFFDFFNRIHGINVALEENREKWSTANDYIVFYESLFNVLMVDGILNADNMALYHNIKRIVIDNQMTSLYFDFFKKKKIILLLRTLMSNKFRFGDVSNFVAKLKNELHVHCEYSVSDIIHVLTALLINECYEIRNYCVTHKMAFNPQMFENQQRNKNNKNNNNFYATNNKTLASKLQQMGYDMNITLPINAIEDICLEMDIKMFAKVVGHHLYDNQQFQFELQKMAEVIIHEKIDLCNANEWPLHKLQVYYNKHFSISNEMSAILDASLKSISVSFEDDRNETFKYHKMGSILNDQLIFQISLAKIDIEMRMIDAKMNSNAFLHMFHTTTTTVVDVNHYLNKILSSSISSKSMQSLICRIRCELTQDTSTIYAWLTQLIFPDFIKTSLTECLRKTIHNKNINHTYIQQTTSKEFISLLCSNCDSYMSETLAMQLWIKLPSNDIYKECLICIDRWWIQQKMHLKRELLNKALNKQTFVINLIKRDDHQSNEHHSLLYIFLHSILCNYIRMSDLNTVILQYCDIICLSVNSNHFFSDNESLIQWFSSIIFNEYKEKNRTLHLKKVFMDDKNVNGECISHLTRREFACIADLCFIPRGISSKLFRNLKQMVNNSWTALFTFHYVLKCLKEKEYHRRNLLIKIMQNRNCGKNGFYRAIVSSDFNELHDNIFQYLIKNVPEIQKKDSVHKQIANEMLICLTFERDIFLQNSAAKLSSFVDEKDMNDHFMIEIENEWKMSQMQYLNEEKEKEENVNDDNTSSYDERGAAVVIQFEKSFHQWIGDIIYPMDVYITYQKNIKSYLRKNRIDSASIPLKISKNAFKQMLINECQIAQYLALHLCSRCLPGDQRLTCAQFGDHLSNELELYRAKELKSMERMLVECYPSPHWTNKTFVNEIIATPLNLDEFVIKLIENPKFKINSSENINIKQKIVKYANGLNIAQDDKKMIIYNIFEQIPFSQWLANETYGSGADWQYQKQELHKYIMKNIEQFSVLRKSEFGKKLHQITGITSASSGTLFSKVIGCGKHSQYSKQNIFDETVKVILEYRNKKISALMDICHKYNVNENEWQSALDVEQFFTQRVEYRPGKKIPSLSSAIWNSLSSTRQPKKPMSTKSLFSSFFEWFSAVIYNVVDFQREQLRIQCIIKQENVSSQYLKINTNRNAFALKINKSEVEILWKKISIIDGCLEWNINQFINHIQTFYSEQRKEKIKKLRIVCNQNISTFIFINDKNWQKLFLSQLNDDTSTTSSIIQFIHKLSEMDINQSNIACIAHQLLLLISMKIHTISYAQWLSNIICFTIFIELFSAMKHLIFTRKWNGKNFIQITKKSFISAVKSLKMKSKIVHLLFDQLQMKLQMNDTLYEVCYKMNCLLSKIILTEKKSNIENRIISNEKKSNQMNDIHNLRAMLLSDIHSDTNMIKTHIIHKYKISELYHILGIQQLKHQLRICLELHQFNTSSAHKSQIMKKSLQPFVARVLSLKHEKHSISNLNKLSVEQIACCVCNLLMKDMHASIANMRDIILNTFPDVNGKILYKLVGSSMVNETTIIIADDHKDEDQAQTLSDVDVQQCCKIVNECILADQRQNKKLLALRRSLEQEKINGINLFHQYRNSTSNTNVNINLESFLNSRFDGWLNSVADANTNLSFVHLLAQEVNEWKHMRDNQAFIAYILSFDSRMIREHVIRLQMNGHKFLQMRKVDFVNAFTDVSGINKGGLMSLFKSIQNYSFLTDYAYKHFITHELRLSSALSKLIINGFANNERIIRHFSNAQLARWISQYPINALYDVLCLGNVDASMLQTQLNIKLFHDQCGFTNIAASDIEKYYDKIARDPFSLIVTDFHFIFDLYQIKCNKNDHAFILQCNADHNNVANGEWPNECPSVFTKYSKQVKELNAKPFNYWTEFDVCSYLLQELSLKSLPISTIKKMTLAKEDTLVRLFSQTFTQYEILLCFGQFKTFINNEIRHKKFNASKMIAISKEESLHKHILTSSPSPSPEYAYYLCAKILDKKLQSQYSEIAQICKKLFIHFHEQRLHNMHKQIIEHNLAHDLFEIVSVDNDDVSFDMKSGIKQFKQLSCETIKIEWSVGSDIVKYIVEDARKKHKIHPCKDINAKIKWLTNYESNKLHQSVMKYHFTWVAFEDYKNEKNKKHFKSCLKILSAIDCQFLFHLMNKEYHHRFNSEIEKYSTTQQTVSNHIILCEIPSVIVDDQPIPGLSHFCNGRCHDMKDSMHMMNTAFSQLLCFMKIIHDSHTKHINISYHMIKQMWFQKCLSLDLQLPNKQSLSESTFDNILMQAKNNANISNIIHLCMDAFHCTSFIKQLKEYTPFTTALSVFNYLWLVISNLSIQFESKYLISRLLEQCCKHFKEYVQMSNMCQSSFMMITDAFHSILTVQERNNLQSYLNQYPNISHNCMFQHKHRSLLCSIVRVSAHRNIQNISRKHLEVEHKTVCLNLNKTIYSGSVIPATITSFTLATPTINPNTMEKNNVKHLFLRLQSSTNCDSAHFLDLSNVNMCTSKSVVLLPFNGYLFAPFIITDVYKMCRRNDKQSIQHLYCTNVKSVPLDCIDPQLMLQQFADEYFVLLRMHRVIGSSLIPFCKQSFPDSKDTDDHPFILQFRKQCKLHLHQWLKKYVQLPNNCIIKIQNSTLVNIHSFMHITHEQLNLIGIESTDINHENIMNCIQEKRELFHHQLEEVLENEFADIKPLQEIFSLLQISSFDHSIFRNCKQLEKHISSFKWRLLLMQNKYVIGACFKKVCEIFKCCKQFLTIICKAEEETANSSAIAINYLQKIFGPLLYSTLNDATSIVYQTKSSITDVISPSTSVFDSFVNRVTNALQSFSDFRAEHPRNKLSLIFLPLFENELEMELNENIIQIQQLLHTYYRMSNKCKEFHPFSHLLTIEEMIDLKNTHDVKLCEFWDCNCFVLVGVQVIGYIQKLNKRKAGSRKRKNCKTLKYGNILNISCAEFLSHLQLLRCCYNADHEIIADLMNYKPDGSEVRMISDKPLVMVLQQLIVNYEKNHMSNIKQYLQQLTYFGLAVQSIKHRCLTDWKNKRYESEIIQNDLFLDAVKQWKDMNLMVYDIVHLNINNMSYEWLKNHRHHKIGDKSFGIITRIVLASVEEQKEFHERLESEFKDKGLNMFFDGKCKRELCKPQKWVWTILNHMKFTHSAMQFVTVEWYPNAISKNRKTNSVIGIYPIIPYMPFIEKAENVPRLFDLILYESKLFFVYGINIYGIECGHHHIEDYIDSDSDSESDSMNQENSIIGTADIWNNIRLQLLPYNIYSEIKPNLFAHVQFVKYRKQSMQIVTDACLKWIASNKDCVNYLPIFVDDCVIRFEKRMPGRIQEIALQYKQSEDRNSKISLLVVNVNWFIKAPVQMTHFVWIGSNKYIAAQDGTLFEFYCDQIQNMMVDELMLVSINCNDRVCRGIDWHFEPQDEENLLGRVTKLESTERGGYEVEVEWDGREEFNYRFGINCKFDVHIVQRNCKYPLLYCGDIVCRGLDWDINSFDNQDAAIGFPIGNDDSSQLHDFTSLQIGVVCDISDYNENESDDDMICQPMSIAHLIAIHMTNHEIESKDENDNRLVHVNWIDDRYAININKKKNIRKKKRKLKAHPLSINDCAMIKWNVHCDNLYRLGYEGKYDISLIGYHCGLPLVRLNEFDGNGDKYSAMVQKYIQEEEQPPGRLLFQKNTNININTDISTSSINSMRILDKWPASVVNRVLPLCSSFLTRRVPDI